MAAKRFTVKLERVGKTATMFRVPFDLKEAFGRARPPVRVTIRGHTWRTTPGVYDGVGLVVVNRAAKAAAAVDAPDRVQVTMELDTEPRKVAVPADLRAALAEAPEAKVAFAGCRSRTGASTWSGSRRRRGRRRVRGGLRRRSSACAQASRTADGTERSLAASVTPLRASGGELDEDAFRPLVDFFVEAGLDGILALGTAGEGILAR